MNQQPRLVKVTLVKDENFLKIKETLTRIGIASKRDNILYQSCHILHKRGDFYIPHFKEMFLLDGKEANLEASDIGRRNTIIDLLVQWKLVRVVDPEDILTPRAPISGIKVVSFKDKTNWTLVAKYTVGKKR
jgi:hypothetical protein